MKRYLLTLLEEKEKKSEEEVKRNSTSQSFVFSRDDAVISAFRWQQRLHLAAAGRRIGRRAAKFSCSNSSECHNFLFNVKCFACVYFSTLKVHFTLSDYKNESVVLSRGRAGLLI